MTTPTPLPHTTHFDDCGRQSAKLAARVAELEHELAEQIRASNASLVEMASHANALRDALEKASPVCDYTPQGCLPSSPCPACTTAASIKTLLSQTPAACLAAHDAEVLERCAKVADECGGVCANELDAHQCAEAIRALAAQAQEVYAYCSMCGQPVQRGECIGDPPHVHAKCRPVAAQEVKP